MVTVLSIAGGWLPGQLNRRGWSVTRARKTGMFIFALCVMPIVFATSVGDWGATLLIGLAASAHQAWSANLYTTVSDMFPKSDGGVGDRHGRDGGLAGRDDVSIFNRHVAGCVQSVKQHHRRLPDTFRHLRGGIPGGVRREPSAGAAIRADEAKSCLIKNFIAGNSREI